MTESAFSPAQREILEPLAGMIGKIFGAYIYTQNRLAALEELLQERGVLSAEEIEEAAQRADERWRSGLMIDALMDQDLDRLLEELRRRMRGQEPA